MVITKGLLISGKSSNGSWSKKQLALLSVQWPPPKNWSKKVIGQEITDESARKFKALKNYHLT